MILFIYSQIALDALLMVGILWLLWKNHRSEKMRTQMVKDWLDTWQARSEMVEREIAEYRAKMEEGLAKIAKIKASMDGIAQIPFRPHEFPVTKEEAEFRKFFGATLAPQKTVEREKIPTLAELEKTRERFQSEISLDLKSILDNQLIT